MDERLPIGGYRSTRKYGDPNYCPSATRYHLKNKADTGETPNARWFGSVREAVAKGYTPCGKCWLVGELAVSRWLEFVALREEMKMSTPPTPKKIQRKLGNT